MTRTAKGLAAGAGSVLITSFLFLFLLAGTMKQTGEETVFLQGAIRLSQFEDESIREEEVYSTSDVPKVESMEKIDPAMDTSLNQPALEMEMPSVALDIAAEMAGTIPMAGLNSLEALSAMGAPSGGALTLGEVDETPKALYTPQPLYPSEEKARGIEKEVTVRIRLRKDGTVAEAQPIRQTSETKPFHDAAIRAVLQWRFMPCRKGGRAVMCIADQPISFSLGN